MSLNFNLNISEPSKNSIKLDGDTIYDFIVLGGGPSGLNAALYAKRKGLSTGIIASRVGGQLLNTSSVENYLGFPSLSGESLKDKFLTHLKDLEIPILEEVYIHSVNKENDLFHITLNDKRIFLSKTIMIATGSQPRKLDIVGEKEYSNRGVAYCAICDAPLFKGLDVIIAGGGNSAVEAALDVAKVANKVTLVHRSELRADRILIDRLLENPKITVFLQTQIVEIVGNQRMNGVLVLDKLNQEKRVINADGLFIEIGYIPNSDIFKNLVELNERHEILVDGKNQTSLPGCFAAGDVTNYPYKQIVIAVSEGAKAALAANEYLNHLNINQ